MGGSSGRVMKFDPERDIPSLNGKVILVTGGNSGLGKQTIIELAKHSPLEIWLSARSSEKAREAINDIKAQVPHAPPIKFLQMDIASFESISKAAREFQSHSQRLDMLFLNAGVMSLPPGLTKDGYEIQFGTNHLGHALLTNLLLPTLLRTAEQPASDVRVIVVSSSAHEYAPKEQGILFDTLKSKAENISSVTRYGQSKLANILFARELARLYPQFRVASLMPGLVKTNLPNTMSQNSLVMRVAWKMTELAIGVDVKTGALTQLWAATSSSVISGEYYTPVGRTGDGKRWTNNPDLARKLWDWTELEIAKWNQA